MAGRMPIFGQSPTKRPEVLMVMEFLSSRQSGRPTPRASAAWESFDRCVCGHHHADRQQQVGVDALFAGRDREGEVRAARRVVELEAAEALERDVRQELAELSEDARLVA